MYVITGGTGFLGSNLIAGIQERNLGEIAVVDYFKADEQWRNIAKRNLSDLIFPDKLFEFLNENKEKITTVVHINYTGTTDESDIESLISERIHLTWKLWQWCAENQIPFVYDSTAGVYGDGALGFKDENSLEELEKLRPLSAAGWTKLFLDKKIASAVENGEKTPPQWIGLRCFNLYGPNEYHQTRHQSVVPRIYTAAKNGRLFPLYKSENPAYKDGEQMRDFIWIEDVVDVILWLLERPEISGFFNVGTGQARTYADVLTSVYAAIDEKPEMDFVDLPAEKKSQYQYFTQADVQKLRSLGYTKQFTSLEEGVAKYIKEYLEMPDKYK